MREEVAFSEGDCLVAEGDLKTSLNFSQKAYRATFSFEHFCSGRKSAF
jgi:hypothetical protein